MLSPLKTYYLYWNKSANTRRRIKIKCFDVRFEQYFVDREKSETLNNCFRHERLYLVVGCGNTRKIVLNAVWSIHWSVALERVLREFLPTKWGMSRFLHTLGNLELFCSTNHWFTVYNLRAILAARGSLSGWFLARKPSSDDQKKRRSRRDFPARSILSVWNKNDKMMETCRSAGGIQKREILG